MPDGLPAVAVSSALVRNVSRLRVLEASPMTG